MATEKKSIIEEALLEAKTLEDALKANTKEILANHMKQEIETIVETSLKEGDVDNEGSDVKENEGPVKEQAEEEALEVLAGDDSDEEFEEETFEDDDEYDDDEGDFEETEEESEYLNLDGDTGGEGIELDIAELPINLDLGDEGDLDLTASSDAEVLTVFKAMGDEDEVEVVKDEDGIYLADNETGAEYYIRESEQLGEDGLCEGCGSHVDEEELVYEIELDEHQSLKDERDEERGEDKYLGISPDHLKRLSKAKQGYNARDDERLGMKHHYASLEEDDDIYEDDDLYEGDYEGEEFEEEFIDEHGNPWGGDEDDYSRRKNRKGIRKRRGDVDHHYKDYEGPFGGNKGDKSTTHPGEEDYIEEDKTKQRVHGQRRSGAKVGSPQASPYGSFRESRNPRRPLTQRRKEARNVRKVNDSKIMKEYKELKSKNEQYKGALKVFKDKLNEVALFNTNLAYVNRLFTEHSTTKKEKMSILKRFDGAEGVKESKSIYKSIKEELDVKTPITESVDNKVNRTVKSSASDLNESTAYVDPQISAIKDLMRRIS